MGKREGWWVDGGDKGVGQGGGWVSEVGGGVRQGGAWVSEGGCGSGRLVIGLRGWWGVGTGGGE